MTLTGTTDDPNYKAQAAYVFQRNKRLLEPINLPLAFSNAILENGLPEHVQKLCDNAPIDDEFADYCQRRISWCLNGDSALRRLPLNREFPYLDQNPPRVWGVVESRKENHILHSLYDMSSSWMAKKYGFNGNVVRQKVSNPHCILPLNRDDKLALLDLECDFITLLSPVSKDTSKLLLSPFDSNYIQNTSNADLQSIHPLSWEIAFDSRNFYKTDYDFELPRNSAIQNIFLSHNGVRRLPDVNCQGRAIMFCYGFALQQSKNQAQTDDVEAITLKKPITVSCIYTNQVDYKVGFVLFQLNSTKSGDTSMRNQVWLSEPKSVSEDIREVMADVVTVQSLGIYN